MGPWAVAGACIVLELLVLLAIHIPLAGVAVPAAALLIPMPDIVCVTLDLSNGDGVCPPTLLTLSSEPLDGPAPPLYLWLYLSLAWCVISYGMQQSANRDELWDLTGQLAFYKSYHSDPVNVAIHAIFVPIILWTAIGTVNSQ